MLPVRLRSGGNLRYIVEYWQQRDDDLSTLVVNAAAAIRSAPGKPRRVSVSSIARDLTEYRALHFQRDKIPKTQSALALVTESEEDFAIRRVLSATEQFRAAGVRPTFSQLMVRAGLRQHVGLGLQPAVRAATEAAIETLPPRPIVLKGRWANARLA